MGYPWTCGLVLAYYFIIFIRKESIFHKGIINLFFLKKELQNLILNYKFFYSQIFFFYFMETYLIFFIKALNNFFIFIFNK